MNYKPELNRCLKLLECGFSLLTVKNDKLPNINWKGYQTTAPTADVFENLYNMPNTQAIGIITGYNDVECLDIDLKVLPDFQSREAFWNEYLSFLKDNIEDFNQKFIICKTQNSGYHIIYKCKTITGNKSIAKLKGHQTCIIESRGVGGYIFVYQNFILGSDYSDIKEISSEDREIIWSCSKTYNHIEDHEKDEQKYIAVEKEFFENDIKIWDDFNNKNSVWNLISSEFDIVKKLSNKLIIRRHGAKSPHSGYIFDNSKCLYLFSTGTVYPAEKLLNPFAIYTIKNHFGDFKAAARELYTKGYGSRNKPKKTPKIDIKLDSVKTDIFPIEIFPESLQNYIIQVHKTLNASIDYLGCSMLWVLSLSIGNALKLEVKRGWIEAAVIWIAIVGRAGIGKTHNIISITKPLLKINERELQKYNSEIKEFNEYKQLDKKEKQFVAEVREPAKTQFIVGDITLEAFFDHHEQNKIGIGILRDELSGWIKDLNKYRPGSDLETYLSCWSNQQIILNRKTAKSSYVANAFVPIIGGVQPSILNLHYTSENKDNGFLDRWLLCYPELSIEKYNENELNQDLINWYSEYIVSFFDTIRNNLLNFDTTGNISYSKCRFSDPARKEWIRIFNKITDMQNSDEENEYMKSILPKQKSYVARFSLLLNTLYSFEDSKISIFEISEKAILAAEKLSDYFIKMAKKNKFEAMELGEIKDTIKFSGKHTTKEQFISLYEANNELNRTQVAELLNVSRSTIMKWIKELSKKSEPNAK